MRNPFRSKRVDELEQVVIELGKEIKELQTFMAVAKGVKKEQNSRVDRYNKWLKGMPDETKKKPTTKKKV